MKPLDISKFRKSITKAIPGVSVGFNDPVTWLDTGCYALNYLISGDFYKGVPLEGKQSLFAGASGCLPKSAKITIRLNESEEDDREEVTVEELKMLFKEKKSIEIDTPDGFQKITAWFDKGVLPMVEITTESGLVTRCATNHLLQLSTRQHYDSDNDVLSPFKIARTYEGNPMSFGFTTNDELCWVHAENILPESFILAVNVNGVQFYDRVLSVETIEPEECYDFTVDHPNHRYWGDGFSSHNSGKSFLVSGNIIKDAQAKGVAVVLFDTENALDETWLHALGVDTSPEKLIRVSVALVDDVAKTMAEIIDAYKDDYAEFPKIERPKLLFVIDSLGMLITPNNERQFNDGDMKGDMGIKAKQITALLRTSMAKIASENIGVIATNHVYDSQDIYKPAKIAGGQMVEFATSIIVQMEKLLLKEDEFGVKLTGGVTSGIRSSVTVRKSRYSKPFENVKIDIPYETGMNKYSGLFDLFFKKGVLVREGNSYIYTSPVTGEFFKEARKNLEPKHYDTIMSEWSVWESKNTETVIENIEEETLEETF